MISSPRLCVKAAAVSSGRRRFLLGRECRPTGVRLILEDHSCRGTAMGAHTSDTVGTMSDVARRVAASLRSHPTATDTGVAVLLAAAAMASASTTFELVRQDPSIDTPAKPALVVALLAVTLPLAVRRLYPIRVAAVVITAFIVGRIALRPSIPGLGAWEGYVTVWACWLALYTAVVHRPEGRRNELAIAAMVAALLIEIVREDLRRRVDRTPPHASVHARCTTSSFLHCHWCWAGPFAPLECGRASWRHRLRSCNASAKRNARRAVLEERVRIARELHDVIAHHVSVMGVQAGVARRVMATRPEKAEEVLSSIESSSRQAVVELHQLLGFLRRADQPDQLEPQPHLSNSPSSLPKRNRAGWLFGCVSRVSRVRYRAHWRCRHTEWCKRR